MEKILKSHLLAERKLTLGRSVYMFSDLQVRNILHDGISLVRRRRYHLKIGQVMEELFKDKIEAEGKFGELAYHFLEGNEQEKSLLYCVKAGMRANKVYAHEEAAKQLKLALELLEGNQENGSLKSQVLERLADTEYVIGQGDAALDHYAQAAKLCEQRGDMRNAGNVLRKRGFTYYAIKYDMSGTRETLDKAMELLEDYSESEELAQLLAVLGRFNHYTGQFAKGVEVARKALVLGEKLKLHEVESLAHEALALLAPLTEKDSMLIHSRKGLEIALQYDLPFAASANYWMLSKINVACKADIS